VFARQGAGICYPPPSSLHGHRLGGPNDSIDYFAWPCNLPHTLARRGAGICYPPPSSLHGHRLGGPNDSIDYFAWPCNLSHTLARRGAETRRFFSPSFSFAYRPGEVIEYFFSTPLRAEAQGHGGFSFLLFSFAPPVLFLEDLSILSHILARRGAETQRFFSFFVLPTVRLIIRRAIRIYYACQALFEGHIAKVDQ
jgi:hypothetical protein